MVKVRKAESIVEGLVSEAKSKRLRSILKSAQPTEISFPFIKNGRLTYVTDKIPKLMVIPKTRVVISYPPVPPPPTLWYEPRMPPPKQRTLSEIELKIELARQSYVPPKILDKERLNELAKPKKHQHRQPTGLSESSINLHRKDLVKRMSEGMKAVIAEEKEAERLEWENTYYSHRDSQQSGPSRAPNQNYYNYYRHPSPPKTDYQSSSYTPNPAKTTPLKSILRNGIPSQYNMRDVLRLGKPEVAVSSKQTKSNLTTRERDSNLEISEGSLIALAKYAEVYKQVYKTELGDRGLRNYYAEKSKRRVGFKPLPPSRREQREVESGQTEFEANTPGYNHSLIQSQDFDTSFKPLKSALKKPSSSRGQTPLPPWVTREEWNEKKEHIAFKKMQILEHANAKSPARLYTPKQMSLKEKLREMSIECPYFGEGKPAPTLFRTSSKEKRQEAEMERRQNKIKQTLADLIQQRARISALCSSPDSAFFGFPLFESNATKDHKPLTPSQVEMNEMKMQYYHRMASFYNMKESEKKERERQRLMQATKCIFSLCPSLIGEDHRVDSSLARTPRFGSVEDVKMTDPATWFLSPKEKRPMLKRLGYNTTTFKSTVSRRGLKKPDSSKEFKHELEKTYGQLEETPESHFFKICPDCRKYVRMSDWQTHGKECCTPEEDDSKETHPTKIDYYDGTTVKSYHLKHPTKTASPKDKLSTNQGKGGLSPKPTAVSHSGDAGQPNPNPNFSARQILEFHPSGYYFAPVKLDKLKKYVKPIPLKELLKRQAEKDLKLKEMEKKTFSVPVSLATQLKQKRGKK